MEYKVSEVPITCDQNAIVAPCFSQDLIVFGASSFEDHRADVVSGENQ